MSSSRGAARLPGPRSRYPGEVFLAFRRDPLGYLAEAARRYGDVCAFRVANFRYVLVNEPELIRQVLVTQAGQFTKGPALERAKVTLGDGLLTSEGEFHRRQRKVAQPAFHAQRVAAYAGDMVQDAVRMREGWREGQRIDIHHEMMALTLSVVARTLFGQMLESEVDAIGEAMTVSVKMFRRALLPWGPVLSLLPLPSNRRFWRARALINRTIDGFIAQRKVAMERGEAAGDDFLSLLLRARQTDEEGSVMTDQVLRDQAVTLFTAGHETTANALTFTWHLLSHHPEVERKLHLELDEVLGGRLATAEDVPRLVYARRVLAESMRLYPPAWAIGRRLVGEWRAGEYEVPRRSVVLMSQWVMHRDERYWPEAERFDPERWTEEAEKRRPRFAYFPFGSGPRSCIGEAFAWLEATLLLVTIAQRWRVEAVVGERIELEPTITLRPKGALPMVARAR